MANTEAVHSEDAKQTGRASAGGCNCEKASGPARTTSSLLVKDHEAALVANLSQATYYPQLFR